MKPIDDIKFGFSDAENYRRRENKNLFDKIFLRTAAIEEIKKQSTFFLVGEKGTGKTAYAVHFASDTIDNTKSTHKYIRDTDYHKFVTLRQDKQLGLSEYTDIWRVIIYMLMADAIYASAGTAEFLIQYPKFRSIKNAIDDYYANAFSPEIMVALQFVEHSAIAAELVAKYGPVTGKASASTDKKLTKDRRSFQTNLLVIEKALKDAISSVRLRQNHIIFIDGIDIRPSSIPYDQYLECVRGLANAVWSVNNDFFPSIRDSQGRLRTIALLRPDIFNSLGLQNRNTKLRDNSAILNWKVVYYNHRQSELFKTADRMFSAQQDHAQLLGACWDHYFPFEVGNVRADERNITSFVLLLRNSWHRPRDIFSILDILKAQYKPKGRYDVFQFKDFVSADFRRELGNYLLGEVRDSLSFYYSEGEFEHFLKFFEFLDGKQKFSYEKYLEAYVEYQSFINAQSSDLGGLNKSPEEFLQVLYEQNIISFFEDTEEGERFVRWCFLERSSSNLSPKVKSGLDYEVHYGIANALNIGKDLRSPRRNVTANLSRKASSTLTQKVSAASLPSQADNVATAVVVAPGEKKRRRRRKKRNPVAIRPPTQS